MAASEVAIYNMAFDLLQEEEAISPSDDRAVVRWMNRNYAPVRDAVLRRHPWNFALERASLAELGTAPAFGWNHAYQLPADCLRILPLTYDGALNGASLSYEVEGRKILTDEIAPLKIRYIKRVTDTTQFDPLFDQLLAAELALRASNWISGKQSYTEQIREAVRQANSMATLVDALEGTPPETEDNALIDVRYQPAAFR